MASPDSVSEKDKMPDPVTLAAHNTANHAMTEWQGRAAALPTPAIAPGATHELDWHLTSKEKTMTDERGKDVYGLIRGAFTTDDARELLMTLLDNKIGFHQLNNRSRRERFGESDAAVVKRVDELRQTKADIATLIDEAAAAGMKLSISCNIEIAPVKE